MELELTRSPDDRRRHVVEGLGTITGRLVSTGVIAEANGCTWRFSRRGLLRSIKATDAGGSVIGTFSPRSIRRGGCVEWRGRRLDLRPAGQLSEHFILVDGDYQVLRVEGPGFGRRPMLLSMQAVAAADPGLVLFTVHIVQRLAATAARWADHLEAIAACGGAVRVGSGGVSADVTRPVR